ncbi:MarR family winged helix-turn-helix transcriptional regulator [Nocardia sp. CNY236]|uniref:MarR family winged helix-turn-helix transcriptional regulator n=1 Tax=Nocardia sp. CNY236 TaxID=1169152 RepID=UPI001E409670|nr:MarR family winged helix-turn-helix transcriptional regulator [Nocardia sp. CNY236]
MDAKAMRSRRSRPGVTTPDGGPALFRLVRFWSRRWTGRALAQVSVEPDGDLRQVQHIQVVEAVAARLQTTDEASVTTVATELGLDHSGASRMVRGAVVAGYLTRSESAHDRRRAVLHLTDNGQHLLATARGWQRQCFDQLTASWSGRDRRQFAAYLQRLADETTT